MHLDEVFLRMHDRRVYLWRAVDEDGKVVDVLVQECRDAYAAERFFRLLLNCTGEVPKRIVTDKLVSYAAAKQRIPSLSPPASPAQRRRVPKHDEGPLPDLARGHERSRVSCTQALLSGVRSAPFPWRAS